jgi:hypothetical protein
MDGSTPRCRSRMPPARSMPVSRPAGASHETEGFGSRVPAPWSPRLAGPRDTSLNYPRTVRQPTPQRQQRFGPSGEYERRVKQFLFPIVRADGCTRSEVHV